MPTDQSGRYDRWRERSVSQDRRSWPSGWRSEHRKWIPWSRLHMERYQINNSILSLHHRVDGKYKVPLFRFQNNLKYLWFIQFWLILAVLHFIWIPKKTFWELESTHAVREQNILRTGIHMLYANKTFSHFNPKVNTSKLKKNFTKMLANCKLVELGTRHNCRDNCPDNLTMLLI